MSGRLLEQLSEEPVAGLANATLYLDAAGHISIAWMWLRQATAALACLEQGSGDRDHLEGKIWTCQYFFHYVLPQNQSLRDVLGSGDRTTVDMPSAGF